VPLSLWLEGGRGELDAERIADRVRVLTLNHRGAFGDHERDQLLVGVLRSVKRVTWTTMALRRLLVSDIGINGQVRLDLRANVLAGRTASGIDMPIWWTTLDSGPGRKPFGRAMPMHRRNGENWISS